MALVTSVVFLSNGMMDDLPKFMRQNYPEISKLKRLHFESSGPKCCEIDIRAVGFNYLDVDEFYRKFDQFPWRHRPTIVVREREGDLIHFQTGDESTVDRRKETS